MLQPRIRNAFSFFFAAAALIVVIVIASAFGPLDSAARAAESDSLPSLLDKWRRCKAAGDVTLIAHYLHDSFVGVGPTGRGEDRREFITRLADPALKVDESSTRQHSVRLYGKAAVITGVHQISGSLGEKDISGDYRFVEVWTNTSPSGRWLLIASTLSRVQE